MNRDERKQAPRDALALTANTSARSIGPSKSPRNEKGAAIPNSPPRISESDPADLENGVGRRVSFLMIWYYGSSSLITLDDPGGEHSLPNRFAQQGLFQHFDDVAGRQQ
jgi:hypothetical protein